jgi:hypothetical protein
MISESDTNSEAEIPGTPLEISEREQTNILAEYQTLRDDILKRIEFRYQLINLVLVVAGTFLTVGLQFDNSATILLVYPILALFLAAGWAHNGVVMVKIGRYIRDNIEPKLAGLNWQTFTEKSFPQLSSFSILGPISTSGLIFTSQLLALILAIIKFTGTLTEWGLLILSSLALLITGILLWQVANFRR